MKRFETSYLYEDARVKVTGYTDTPHRGYANEDGYLYLPNQGLALLADGSSSSHNARLAVEVGMGSVIQSLWGVWLDNKNYQQVLKQAMKGASAEVGRKAPGSWTTMVAGRFQVIKPGEVDAYIGSVGDSRAYVLNPGERLRRLTRDHSLLWAAKSFDDQEKEKMTDNFDSLSTREEYDALTPVERWFYSEQNWVTQILGSPDLKYPKRYEYPLRIPRALQPRIVRETLMQGGKLVLISDGPLVLTTAELEGIVKDSENPAKDIVTASITRMTEGADHFRSGRDDATALVVEAV
jgi:serine/threonine protein phosphatase PrpC